MKSFQILNSEISFSTERVNYFKATMMYRNMASKARQQLEQEYLALGNMKRVMENLVDAAFHIYQDVIQKSVEYIQGQDIYTIDFNGLLEHCACDFQKYFVDPFEAIYAQYEEIIYEKKEAEEYRQRRKANRARYSGWGYGIGGAISSSVKAGTLNMATGIGHSLVNGIGNAGSSAVSAAKQSALYKNEEIRERLFEGIYDASYMVCGKVMDIISRHSNIRFEGISKDKAAEARALSNNILANGIPEQHIRDAIIQSLSINPENKDLMRYVIEYYGDADKNIEQMGEFFGYDLKPAKQEAIRKIFGEIEDKGYETETQLLTEKEAVIKKCAELGLDAAPYTAVLDAKWSEIDKALRTVESIEYPTREIARNVEKDIGTFDKKCMEFHWDDMDLLDEDCRHSCEMEVRGEDYLEDMFVAQIRERLERIWEPYIYRQDIIRRLSNPDTFMECLKEIVTKEPVYEALRKKIYFYDCAEKIKDKVPISSEEARFILLCIDRTMLGVGKKGTIFTSQKIIEYDKQKISWAYLKEVAGISPENDAFSVVDTKGNVILTIPSPGNLSDENRRGLAALMHAIAVGTSRTDIEALEKKLSDISKAQQEDREEKNKSVYYSSSDKSFLWKTVKDGFHSYFNGKNADMTKEGSTTGKNWNVDKGAVKFCSNCGSQLRKGALFCHECGAKVENERFSPEQ